MKTIFLHIPKCGGTSIQTFLRHQNGVKHCDALGLNYQLNMSHASLINSIYPNWTSISGHTLRLSNIGHFMKSDNTKAFTILREPYSRFLSFYFYKSELEPNKYSLDEIYSWCKNGMTRHLSPNQPQEALSLIKKHNVNVGILEEMERSYELFSENGIILKLPQKKMKSTKKTDFYYQLLNDQNLRSKFIEDNKQDYELYNHFRDEIIKLNKKQLSFESHLKEANTSFLKRNIFYKPFVRAINFGLK
jgi:hypothetical protein